MSNKIRDAGLKARDELLERLAGSGSVDNDLADHLASIVEACVKAAAPARREGRCVHCGQIHDTPEYRKCSFCGGALEPIEAPEQPSVGSASLMNKVWDAYWQDEPAGTKSALERVVAVVQAESAAPEMLAALQRLTDYSRKPTQSDWQAADDAIAKAETPVRREARLREYPPLVKLGEMPAIGRATDADMLAALSEAIYGYRDHRFQQVDDGGSLGRQMVPLINFNSLARVITAFVNGSHSLSLSYDTAMDDEKSIISNTIGFNFEPNELQTVNADDLVRLATALSGAREDAS